MGTQNKCNLKNMDKMILRRERGHKIYFDAS